MVLVAVASEYYSKHVNGPVILVKFWLKGNMIEFILA